MCRLTAPGSLKSLNPKTIKATQNPHLTRADLNKNHDFVFYAGWTGSLGLQHNPKQCPANTSCGQEKLSQCRGTYPPFLPQGAPSQGEEIQGAVFKKIRVSPQLWMRVTLAFSFPINFKEWFSEMCSGQFHAPSSVQFPMLEQSESREPEFFILCTGIEREGSLRICKNLLVNINEITVWL